MNREPGCTCDSSLSYGGIPLHWDHCALRRQIVEITDDHQDRMRIDLTNCRVVNKSSGPISIKNIGKPDVTLHSGESWESP